MALDRLTKVDGGGISTTSDYRVGIITASKFVGPFDGSGGNFSGVVTATNGVFSGNISAVDGNFSGNVTIGGTLTYEDVTNIDSVGIITAQKDIHIGAGLSVVGVGTFGSLDIGGDIDVDGHTNLDNVSVAGVTTFASTIVGTNATFSGNINNSPAGSGSISGFGAITIQAPTPALNFTETDADPDYRIIVLGGQLRIQDVTNSNANRFIINTDGTTSIEKNLNCLSDLDVDGHTNLDNVSIAGVTTFSDEVNIIQGKKINFGNINGTNGHIYYDGSTTRFQTNAGLNIGAPVVSLKSANLGEVMLDAAYNGAVRLFYDYSTYNTPKLVTTATGVTIDGTAVAGGLDISGDIDVDGHTNLDNVSVAGVTTFSGDVVFSGDGDNITFDKSSDDLIFNNGTKAVFGTNSDGVEIYHASNNSFINDTGTGALILDGSKIRLRLSGSTQLETDTNGIIATGTAHRFQSGTSGDCELIIEADTDNNNELDNPRILFRQDGGSDWSAIGTNDNTLEISNSVSNGGILFKTGGTNGYTNATGRWKIDTNGHLLPNTAGAVNIGSATAEIGDVYIADDKKLYLGSSQDVEIYHSSGNVTLFNSPTNRQVQLKGDGGLLIRASGNQNIANFVQSGVTLYHSVGNAYTARFVTTSTGITVTGEVAATQDYPDIRPTLDLNFAAVKKLDSRITYQRTGPASFVNEFGKVVIVGANTPRFDHDIVTRESKGLLIEESRTNLFLYGTTPGDNWTGSKAGTFEENTTETTAPDGTFTATKWTFTTTDPYLYQTTNLSANTTYTMSMWVKAGTNMAGDWLQFRIGGAPYSTQGNSIIPADGTWRRITYTRTVGGSAENSASVGFEPQTSPSGNPASGDVIYIWGAQLEVGSFVTSFIPTNGSTTTRGADIVSIDNIEDEIGYNQHEGAVIMEYKYSQNPDGSNTLFAFSGTEADPGSSSIRQWLRINQSAGTPNTIRYIQNSNTNDSSATATEGIFQKFAFAYEAGDQDVSLDGTSILDTSRTPSTNIFRLTIGTIGWNLGLTTVQLKGHVKRFIYYPKKLPNSQLNTLTS